MSLTLEAYCAWIKNWSLDAFSVANDYVKKIKNDTTNSFVRTHEQYIEDHASDFSDRVLCGAAIWVKDIFMTKWYESSCGSAMLEGYIPPYTATSMKKLEKAWWLMIGKTNMDEFAMWSSWETSYFGPVKNPYDNTRVAWWSSSWSPAAVALDLCIASLWTDTWWSIRLPASLCGVVWIKPTYWRISRYGVQAMASSFDHVWVFSKNVKDGLLVTQAMSGQDCHDATTTKESCNTAWRLEWLGKTDLKWKNLAVIKQFMGDGMDEDCRALVEETIDIARWLWAKVTYIDLPIVEFVLNMYYILVPAEVSTNMAKFDGVRFGHQKNPADYSSIYEYYANVRKEWFGDEVKRRILTWSYVLSAGYYDAYYKKALRARKKLQGVMGQLFKEYDAIIWPMSVWPAWKIWEMIDDPTAMYLMDIYAVLANLTQAPAMSIPCGYVERAWKKLPIGFQIMTKKRDEATMFSLASTLEQAIQFAPLLSV